MLLQPVINKKMSFHHEIAFRKLILGEAERKRNKTWLDFY